MSLANIKLPSSEIKELQALTGENTGQKAVQRAVLYFIKEARQRKIGDIIKKIQFKKDYNPLKLRHER